MTEDKATAQLEQLLIMLLGTAVGGFTDLNWTDEQIRERVDLLLALIRSNSGQAASRQMARTLAPVVDDIRQRRKESQDELQQALYVLGPNDWTTCSCGILLTPEQLHVCPQCSALHIEPPTGCTLVRQCTHAADLPRLAPLEDRDDKDSQPAQARSGPAQSR